MLARLRTPESRSRLDRLVLAGLVALAAALRLVDLRTRGTWDGDQGHDMLVLRSFVVDGVLPLLGPPTSIGSFHHGALYYYLLSPAAWLTGGDSPLAVVLFIALGGVAAVAVTWWLARSIGGSIAGLVAGLLMAVSISAIDESTFIWNPNLIALSSAIALAGAWRAWSTGRARWWLLAAVGTAVTMQCHVLGVMLLPMIGALLVADARRRSGEDRRRVLLAGLGGLAIVAVSYIPLVVHELTTDFAEVRAAVEYYESAREPSPFDPVTRTVIVGIRIVTWPLVGLITDAGPVALAALALVLAVIALRWRGAGTSAGLEAGGERTAIRWLGLGLLWSTLTLSVAAGSLATVTIGLPNDHYHAFADPMVFTLVGIGIAAAWRWRPRSGARLGALVGVIVVVALVGWNVTRLPPAVNADGGFPAARVAAERIGLSVGDRPAVLQSLPDFKPTDTYGYPLVLDGRTLTGADRASALVLLCDNLFEDAIGASCGGPAEEAEVGPSSRFVELADRWEAAPGRWISVYLARER